MFAIEPHGSQCLAWRHIAAKITVQQKGVWRPGRELLLSLAPKNIRPAVLMGAPQAALNSFVLLDMTRVGGGD